MPPRRYESTEVVPAPETWELLRGGDWEIVERRPGNRALVGSPRIHHPRGFRLSATGVAIEGGAEEGRFGVRTYNVGAEKPSEKWVPSAEQAREEFAGKLAYFGGRSAGEEQVFRLELVIDGATEEVQHVLAGEITPERYPLDSLSLTYLGVVVAIALSVGFGLASWEWWARAAAGVVTFCAVLALTRSRSARRAMLRVARWGLGDDATER